MGGPVTDASSSSTTQPPDLPDAVLPDWTLSIERFYDHGLGALDDGRIATGGPDCDVAMTHIVNPAGALLPGHCIEPIQWGAAPAFERVLELDRLDAQRLPVLSLAVQTTSAPPAAAFSSSTSPQARPQSSGGPRSSKASSSTTRRGPPTKPCAASRSR